MTPAEIAEIAAYAAGFGQRIGQFIDNALTTNGKFAEDLFYIPDAELVKLCRNYYITYKGE